MWCCGFSRVLCEALANDDADDDGGVGDDVLTLARFPEMYPVMATTNRHVVGVSIEQ